MSDHLRECAKRRADWRNAEDCICAELRACEQRVREEDQRILIKHGAEQFVRGERIGKAMGHAAGVQAARDAVAGVGVRKDTSHDMRVQALAAIDALRGSGNPHTPPSAEKGEQA